MRRLSPVTRGHLIVFRLDEYICLECLWAEGPRASLAHGRWNVPGAPGDHFSMTSSRVDFAWIFIAVPSLFHRLWD